MSEMDAIGYFTSSVSAISPSPVSLMINMTKLDEICDWAQGFTEIVLIVDGKTHRYKTADVLEILKEIELD